MARVQGVSDEGVAFYEHQIAKDEGITLLRGWARFSGEHTIDCEGETVEFEQALIATGARPRLPDLPGLADVPFVTSDDLLRIRELPHHLICLGAGAVALEFAQTYRRFGARVTVVLCGQRLARGEEPELAKLLHGYLEEAGVTVLTGAQIERAETVGGQLSLVLADGTRGGGDLLLVATGREPVVDGLGLEELGIGTGPKGVAVDEHLRSALPNVYAIGDAIDGWMSTHVSTYEAPIAVTNMLGGAGLRSDYRVVPGAIFTDPELADVGLSEEQALAAGYEVRVRRYDLGRGGKSRALGDRRGRVKLVLDAGRGRILGAHILARRGADLLSGPMVRSTARSRSMSRRAARKAAGDHGQDRLVGKALQAQRAVRAAAARPFRARSTPMAAAGLPAGAVNPGPAGGIKRREPSSHG